MVVGKPSFCDFQTIQEAVNFLEQGSSGEQATLCILSGIYEEQVRIYRSDLRIVGVGSVEITMNRCAKERDEHGEEIGTFATPTLFLGGIRLVVENLTISNTAGPGERVGQAVAVTAYCDQAIFRSCSFKGYQDTLFTGPLPPKPRERPEFGGIPLKEEHESYRQLYQNCYIEGTVDFIFGGATAYFEQCEIRSLQQPAGKKGYITAASTPQGQAHGYVFNRCFLTAEPGVSEVFLGRPWREFAKTVFVDCRMEDHIHPLGWDNWSDPANEKTVCYREYVPSGEMAAALRPKRVPWAGCLAAEEGDTDYRKEHIFAGSDFWKG
ncbi:pectinesterase family protein [Paenibacillus sp. M1]|uniref:Pectinesterase n=1 Tax=Paenibacillus haidiansis TaxID=1574488 RepID=A0ABU7VQG0_9BACL